MNFDSSDLRDPQPPLPGERERSLVAERAHELGRRRRLVQGGGALALVAAVAVSVAALTGGGGTGPGGTNQVEAASSGTDTSVSTPVSHVTTVPTTVVPAPEATVAPAPTPDTTPAAVQEAPVAAPQSDTPVAPAATTFTLSGTVTGNPADTTVTVTINGPGGPYTSSGNSFSTSGLSAGEYTVIAVWEDSTGTATAAVKEVVALSADQGITLAFG
jgi:hypothetical protein